MSFAHDRLVRAYGCFLLFFAVLVLGAGAALSLNQVNAATAVYAAHDEAVASALLAQGIPKQAVASALVNTEVSEDGRTLLAALGTGNPKAGMPPCVSRFGRVSIYTALAVNLILILVLLAGTAFFFRQRKRLYEQAEKVIENYLNGDYSCHMPQNYEGAVFQFFSMVERLATMLQSKSETEHKAREFLKSTISDISHQLKTPLAALVMYQEIIEGEPGNEETVKEFSAKAGNSLKRMEQLIQSMLKITRLDAGSIIFEKNSYSVAELIAHAVNELTTRAGAEGREIRVDGDGEQMIVCDLAWTGEAIGNIVKNALDHTEPGGLVHISWERMPAMLRIMIADDGEGIAPEDIHHIFKRFYRSKHARGSQGTGLGLPLAKAIVEGQGGLISVQERQGGGTVFTVSFFAEDG